MIVPSAQNGWLLVPAPDPEKWEQQEIMVRIDTILSVKLFRELSPNGGPQDAVEIFYGKKNAFERGWIRCGSFEQAETLYITITQLLLAEVTQ